MPQPRQSMISAPLAASLAVILAACDASNLASDHDPSGANQDAASKLDEAGTGEAGVSPFDAGANPFDASAADAQARSDAAGNGPQDAAESARAEASTPDADAQMP